MGTKRASPKSIFEWKCPLFLYLYMYWVLKCKLFILFLSFYKPPSEGTNGGALRSATKVEIQQDESISHCLVVPVFWVAVHMIPERIFLWRERKKYDRMAERHYGNIQKELLPYWFFLHKFDTRCYYSRECHIISLYIQDILNILALYSFSKYHEI